MVLNSSNLVMNNLMGNETRRLLNRSLEKEGVCTPGAGLVYVISERASERFISIEDFSERIQGEIETLSGKKMTTLMWRLCRLMYALVILCCLLYWLGPGVMEQLKLLTIPMSRVGPFLVVFYICRELMGAAAKWKAIKQDQLQLLRRVNNARRRLPVVACIHADEETIHNTDELNFKCYWIMRPASHDMSFFWWDCVLVIVLGVVDCLLLFMFL